MAYHENSGMLLHVLACECSGYKAGHLFAHYVLHPIQIISHRVL